MLCIGLTGGIGSGKSTVAHLFAEKGIDVIDADHISRELVKPGAPAYRAITQHFGNDMLQNDHSLDREKLKKRIFSNSQEKQWLENLLHPLIREAITQAANKASSPYCILVIPLLVEKGKYPIIDRVLVIDSPLELQKKRTLKRDNMSDALFECIIKTQTSREARLNLADDTILNDGSLEKLAQAVEKLHTIYMGTNVDMIGNNESTR